MPIAVPSSRPKPLVSQLFFKAGLVAVAWATATTSQAAGTPAGTAIENAATVSFSIGGTPASTTSNSTTVTVAEIVDVTVTVQSPTVSAAAGTASAALVFLVTNTGNSSETFVLSGDSALVGDDFDPVPATPFIYIDTDSSGDLSAADTPYVAGSNDPTLAADAAVGVILINAIPNNEPDGNRGRSELTALAATGSGTPGTLFAGQGTGGVDAVIGTTGGTAAVFGEYLVGDIVISAVKSQTVNDPFGGSQPVPGATIHYQIVVNATGTGTALGASFNDDVPASTTYVPGTLVWNGAVLTDTADGDAGEYAATPGAHVTVALGDLSAASGPQTIEFEVTID